MPRSSLALFPFSLLPTSHDTHFQHTDEDAGSARGHRHEINSYSCSKEYKRHVGGAAVVFTGKVRSEGQSQIYS